ncbi:dolichyl-phosphate-glucose-glycolipid alpha- glucosyltransferase Alg10 [Schizosaccharomyces cryophilus OY26]|uniref:Dol-P-Glc:Glc(2)Man(9)GlcNAc(2)-PP-Dol alpha-1,2-glucosyltransferase n=1 Tax=Schizosaccharomyces cryophilus (strain OY26 / ATCC MYA-4695 / CBS 11777 / NBRC 106824 / NRRL Y48691) TaxID=653667 RepID=S9XAR5_SCHCR|nr:dolichyl-phosphate-glucose-glycolipid alpha- glucosyltransferase Alg10 [Schizosaccharomyces cryophilus OY26]EPY50821.1 dolichyl-phosphate-glucose-glycolipid alpha- glucosyltransferase Alg10 [Schizosaccharomyces cryophilus OY26]
MSIKKGRLVKSLYGAGTGSNIAVLWILTSLLSFFLVNRYVNIPYMDEIFHVSQTQRYCNQDWEWDPAITTPPGLYLLSYFLKPVLGCHLVALRSLNFVLGVVCLPAVLFDINKQLSGKAFSSPLVLSSLPPLWFTFLLYYTDIASTVIVLLAYDFALRNAAILSSAFCFFSLFFRQTNILWVGYIMVTLITNDLSFYDPVLSEATFVDFFLTITSFIGSVLRNLGKIWKKLLPFVFVFAFSMGFLVWNGGIVLGDKSNHNAVIHLSQMNYFTTFFFFFSFPSCFSPLFKSASWKPKIHSVIFSRTTLLLLPLLLLIVKYNTIIHPFLLADNRHYVFYIFNRIRRYWWLKFLGAPIYAFCYIFFIKNISQYVSVLDFTIITLATLLTLVPAPLVEFRYFILPFLFWRMKVPWKSKNAWLAEFFFHMSLNTISVYIFIYRPFFWHSEPGSLQRFMW